MRQRQLSTLVVWLTLAAAGSSGAQALPAGALSPGVAPAPAVVPASTMATPPVAAVAPAPAAAPAAAAAPSAPIAAGPAAAPPTAAPLRLGPPSDHAAYFRAALEVVAVLGIGVSQYWIAAANNTRDWDFPRWSERLSGVNVRFDNNTQVTNNLLHPLAGAAYYGLSRANGLSVGESVLYAQLASAIWEVGLEWREKVSINDMIVTTAGGTGVGECLVQLAAYLNSAPDGGAWPQDVAAVTLGFPVWVHDELDDRPPDPRPAKDALGFSAAYQHRFRLELQNSWLDDAAEQRQQLFGVRLETQLSSLPGFLTPKTFSTWFAGGNFSEMSLELGFDHDGVASTDVEFDAVLAGHYAQWVGRYTTGLLAGVGTGLEFVDRATLASGDQYALAHFAGPSLALLWGGDAVGVTLASRFYGDFASIHSLAWPEVFAADPGATYKSSLERGYQYNLGVSSRWYLELRFHALRLSGEYTWGRYRSIEGLDRFQEEITRDLEGSEAIDERRVSFALEPSGALLRVYAGVERSSHESQLGPAVAGRLERRFVAGGGIAF